MASHNDDFFRVRGAHNASQIIEMHHERERGGS